jgi:hypothetical protein
MCSAHPKCQIAIESIPEPFIGNPASAKIVFLLLNPGHDQTDKASHSRDDFKAAMFKNLRHETQEHPFYPLNPEFRDTGSAKWWRRRLSKLIERDDVGEQILAEKILAIEWFPYHSCRWAASGRRCSSQEYSFQLAKKMLSKPGTIVVGMRSKRLWGQVDPEFLTVPYLRSPQNVCVSKANMESDIFEQIVNTLKQK